MATNPFTSQANALGAAAPNGRRALVDIYKRRKAGVERSYNDTNKIFGSEINQLRSDYGALARNISRASGNAYSTILASIPNAARMDSAEIASLRGIVSSGSKPYAAAVGGLQSAALQGAQGHRGAQLTEYKTIKQGLPRELSAQTSELEDMIQAQQAALSLQGSAFDQQQTDNARQSSFLNQLAAQQAPTTTTTTTLPNQGGLSGAEQFIVGKESSGDVTADNPNSSAFGLGQLLLANRQKYAAQLGVSPNTTDYKSQLAMMRMYIQERYGTAEAAMAFWQQHGWY